MLRNLEFECVGAEVRDLAKEFDGSFRVAAFQFAICGTHAAKGLELARRADGLASTRRLANILEPALPPVFKTTIAKIGTVFGERGRK